MRYSLQFLVLRHPHFIVCFLFSGKRWNFTPINSNPSNHTYTLYKPLPSWNSGLATPTTKALGAAATTERRKDSKDYRTRTNTTLHKIFWIVCDIQHGLNKVFLVSKQTYSQDKILKQNIFRYVLIHLNFALQYHDPIKSVTGLNGNVGISDHCKADISRKENRVEEQ